MLFAPPSNAPARSAVEVQAYIHTMFCMERPVLLTAAVRNHGDLVATRELRLKRPRRLYG
jgi:hypothetical protein